VVEAHEASGSSCQLVQVQGRGELQGVGGAQGVAAEQGLGEGGHGGGELHEDEVGEVGCELQQETVEQVGGQGTFSMAAGQG